MGLEALLGKEKKSTLSSILSPLRTGLDHGAAAGRTGISVANPLTDLSRIGTSTYAIAAHLGAKARSVVTRKKTIGKVAQDSYQQYKQNLCEGKWLGDGDLSTILYYGGLLGTGAYVPLLAYRFAVGATAQVAKDIALTAIGKKVINFTAKGLQTPLASLGQLMGIPYKNTKKNMSEREVTRTINSLSDDNYFRKAIAPYILEAVIGIKAYGGIVGSKWLATLLERASHWAAVSSSYRPVQYLAQKMEKAGTFFKHALGDYLSFTIAKQGIVRAESLDEKIAHWSDPNFIQQNQILMNLKAGNLDYFMSQDFARYLKDSAIEVAVDTKDAVVNTVNSTVTKENMNSIASTVGKVLAYPFAGTIQEDINKIQEYVTCGKWKADLTKIAKEKFDQVSIELQYSGIVIKQIALSNLGDFTDALGIDTAEKYGLIITGGSDPFIQDLQENGRQQLLHQGVHADNLIIIPHSVASEQLISQTYDGLGQRMDWNDKLVTLIFAHGQQHSEWDKNWKLKHESYCRLDNTGEDFTEQELKACHEKIQNGFGVTIMTPCYSGTYAKSTTPNIFVITSSGNEPNWADASGKRSPYRDFTIRLLETAGRNGGIYDILKDPISLWRVAQRAEDLQNNDLGRGQNSQIGSYGRNNGGVRDLGQ